MSIVSRLGDAMLGIPFMILGYEAAADPGGRVQAAEKLGVPSPELAVKFNGAAMAAGGAALVLGIYPRAAATGLVASLVPTTLAGHAFWNDDDPVSRNSNRIQVLKNLALAGALVGVATRSPKD